MRISLYLKLIIFIFYKVNEYPVYSMATPTISGAKEMLAYLDAKPKASLNARKVILTDLREEAVVYINGTPFVLRELNKPVDTLKHVGITGPLVSHLVQWFVHWNISQNSLCCTTHGNYNAGGTHGGTAERRYTS